MPWTSWTSLDPSTMASRTLLFEMRANVFNARNSYVPSRDGQRFLVNAPGS